MFHILALAWIGVFFVSVNSLISGNASSTPPANVISIAAGEHHSVALKADGTVWTWGYNFYGQLGNGEISPEGQGQATPSQVPDLTGVIAIGAGSFHTLALKGDGTVWAWGDNRDGQLGTGAASAVPQASPVSVPLLKDVVYIAAGGGNSIAVDKDRSVWVWGINNSGQLGDGTTIMRQSPMPVSFPHPGMFAGAGSHVLLADLNGMVFTWGANDSGQLGNGTADGSLTPLFLATLWDNNAGPALKPVIAVAAGGGYPPLADTRQNHSVALRKDGTVMAWGNNSCGQIGDGTGDAARLAPVKVSSLSGVGAVAAGLHHSIALKKDGTVWAWGDNEFGELGDGTITGRNIPVQARLSGVGSIAARGDFTLALKNDGSVWAWGGNRYGELGDGTTIDRLSPVKVTGLDIANSSITGRVTREGSGLQGVTINLSGISSKSTTTGSAGTYSFTGLANGRYTIAPTLTGYTFTPGNKTADLNGTNAGGMDFASVPSGYSISGLLTGEGSDISGVAVSLSGAASRSTAVDSGGNYSFTGLANGKYTITPSLTAHGFTPRNQTVNVNGTDTKRLNFTAASSSYSISGRVTSGGSGLPAVTVTLSGAASGSTTTDSGGNFTFTALANGKYTITPTMAGFNFAPRSQSANVKGANAIGKNFAATFVGFSISGRVTRGGSGLVGVTVNLSGDSSKVAKTDSKGNYIFAGLSDGSYIVTPACSGYSFTPQSLPADVNGNNVSVQDLSATFVGYSISGQVTSGGSGLAGVTVSLSGAASGITVSDPDGNYSFAGLANGRYTITPALTGYGFTPQSQSVTIKGSNSVGKNLAATFVGYSISGQVTSGGSGLAGVTVNLSGDASRITKTDSKGNYSFAGLPNGDYTITVAKNGYGFNPQTIIADVVGGNVNGQNFAAFAGYSISGQVTNGGAGLSGVTISLSGAASNSAPTDSGGNYSFLGLANGGYTITPTLPGYSFTPPSISVPVNGKNVSGQDFQASAGNGSITLNPNASCSYGVAEELSVTISGTASGPVGTEVRAAVFAGDCSGYDPNNAGLPDSCDAWDDPSCIRTGTEPSETNWYSQSSFYYQPAAGVNLCGIVVTLNSNANPAVVLTSKCVPITCGN